MTSVLSTINPLYEKCQTLTRSIYTNYRPSFQSSDSAALQLVDQTGTNNVSFDSDTNLLKVTHNEAETMQLNAETGAAEFQGVVEAPVFRSTTVQSASNVTNQDAATVGYVQELINANAIVTRSFDFTQRFLDGFCAKEENLFPKTYGREVTSPIVLADQILLTGWTAGTYAADFSWLCSLVYDNPASGQEVSDADIGRLSFNLILDIESSSKPTETQTIGLRVMNYPIGGTQYWGTLQADSFTLAIDDTIKRIIAQITVTASQSLSTPIQLLLSGFPSSATTANVTYQHFNGTVTMENTALIKAPQFTNLKNNIWRLNTEETQIIQNDLSFGPSTTVSRQIHFRPRVCLTFPPKIPQVPSGLKFQYLYTDEQGNPAVGSSWMCGFLGEGRDIDLQPNLYNEGISPRYVARHYAAKGGNIIKQIFQRLDALDRQGATIPSDGADFEPNS